MIISNVYIRNFHIWSMIALGLIGCLASASCELVRNVNI